MRNEYAIQTNKVISKLYINKQKQDSVQFLKKQNVICNQAKE